MDLKYSIVTAFLFIFYFFFFIKCLHICLKITIMIHDKTVSGPDRLFVKRDDFTYEFERRGNYFTECFQYM